MLIVLVTGLIVVSLLWKRGAQAPGKDRLEKSETVSEMPSKAHPETVPETTPDTKTVSETTETRGKELPETTKAPEKELTTCEKINEALKKEELTKEEFVVQTILAAYEPERVSEKYRGIPEHRGRVSNLRYVTIWMIKNWESLSEETKEILLPFYVLPDDPRSFHSHEAREWEEEKKEDEEKKKKNDKEEKKTGYRRGFGFISFAMAEEPPTRWTTIYVTLPEDFDPSMKIRFREDRLRHRQRAEWIEQAYLHSHPMFENLLFKKPKNMIVTYLIDFPDPGAYGLAYDHEDENGHETNVILIDDRQLEKLTKSTFAHELFHHFQDEVPVIDLTIADYTAEEKWVEEATAVWAENFAYPDYNCEHGYLPYFFNELHLKLLRNDDHGYQAYTWFLFLERKNENNPDIVRKVLYDVMMKGVKKAALTSLPRYRDLFAEYALWNWNQDPWRRYRDNIPESEEYQPNGRCYKKKTMPEDDEHSDYIIIPEMGMDYRHFVFTEDVKRIAVEFDKEGDEIFRRQALIKVGEVWFDEDWTYELEKTYYTPFVGENIEELIIVFSGSDKWSDIGQDFSEYKVSTKIKDEWIGWTKLSWSHNETRDLGAPPRIKHIVKFSTRGEYFSRDVLKYNHEKGRMEIVRQQETFDSYKCSESEGTGESEDFNGKLPVLTYNGLYKQVITIKGSRMKNYSNREARLWKWQIDPYWLEVQKEMTPAARTRILLGDDPLAGEREFDWDKIRSKDITFYVSRCEEDPEYCPDGDILNEDPTSKWATFRKVRTESFRMSSEGKSLARPPEEEKKEYKVDPSPNDDFEIEAVIDGIPEEILRGTVKKKVRVGMFEYEIKIEYEYKPLK